jgi:tellurite resistance-related uncharacterized protein
VFKIGSSEPIFLIRILRYKYIMDLKNIFVFDTDFSTIIEDLPWMVLENLDWKTSVPYFLPNGDAWATWTPNWCRELKSIVDSKFFKINPVASIELYQMFIHNMPKGIDPSNTIHRDWPMFNTWAAVVMLKGNGGLNFYEEYDNKSLLHTVKFKVGRILIFPSIYWHRVDLVTEDRISVGMLYNSNNLVPNMADVLPLCTCKLRTTQLICDGSHSHLN